MNGFDCYKILKLDRSATNDDIKKSYRKLALKYHPDTNRGGSGSEEKFKEITKAYEILIDPDKRRIYDRVGYSSYNDLFSRSEMNNSDNNQFKARMNGAFFQGGGGCGKRGGGRCRFRGKGFAESSNVLDAVYNIDISPEQALNGIEMKFKLKHEWEELLLRVQIPAGIENGSILKLSGINDFNDLLIRVNYNNER